MINNDGFIKSGHKAEIINETVLSQTYGVQFKVIKVDEETCIGCTKCFKACPTDAIVGAPKQIHAVIKDACTGCKACVDVCPTECLVMTPIEETLKTWHWHKPLPEPIAA